jgi:hypothetical protein
MGNVLNVCCSKKPSPGGNDSEDEEKNQALILNLEDGAKRYDIKKNKETNMFNDVSNMARTNSTKSSRA